MVSFEEKIILLLYCSSIIPEDYSGDPLNLEITVPNLQGCLISFLKSKLDGKVREVLPEIIDSIEQIKNVLSNRIKPDSSKVVAILFL